MNYDTDFHATIDAAVRLVLAPKDDNGIEPETRKAANAFLRAELREDGWIAGETQSAIDNPAQTDVEDDESGDEDGHE